MESGKLIVLGIGALLLLGGCCCLMSDMADGGYDDGYYDYSGDYGGGNAEADYYAGQAGNYEGSDCWSSAGCAGVDSGTYQYEDYSSGSYDYYEQ